MRTIIAFVAVLVILPVFAHGESIEYKLEVLDDAEVKQGQKLNREYAELTFRIAAYDKALKAKYHMQDGDHVNWGTLAIERAPKKDAKK